MILSMTGYGKASIAHQDKKITVEIKSLNSKAFDLSARIAPLYREREMEIRNILSKSIERGKVDFSIWIEKENGNDATPINAALVNNYYEQIKAISSQTGIEEPKDWFSLLLRMPEVMTRTEVEELTEEEWKEIGANIIIYANQLMRAQVPAMQKAAEMILENHRAEECDTILMPFKDIIRLIPAEI